MTTEEREQFKQALLLQREKQEAERLVLTLDEQIDNIRKLHPDLTDREWDRVIYNVRIKTYETRMNRNAGLEKSHLRCPLGYFLRLAGIFSNMFPTSTQGQG